MEKKIIPCLYLKDKKLYEDFSDTKVISESPVDHAVMCSNGGADMLILFDQSYDDASHERRGDLYAKYGELRKDWRQYLRDGFSECFRVLKPGGFLIFKWSETDIKIKSVLALTPEKPVFGHKSGKAMGTHWVCFMKSEKI